MNPSPSSSLTLTSSNQIVSFSWEELPSGQQELIIKSTSTEELFSPGLIAVINASLHMLQDTFKKSGMKPHSFNYVNRACAEAHQPELRLPSRRLEPSLTASEVLSRLSNVSAGTLVSVDIEGGVPNPEETTHRNLPGDVINFCDSSILAVFVLSSDSIS